MNGANVLVAGIGNVFLGDDAFGVEVVRRLSGREIPDGVSVVDYGIRGFDLAYALMGDQDVTILVDAMPRGEEPGTLYTFEPEWNDASQQDAASIPVETHGMNPMKVLAMVRAMGGEPRRVLVVGCEPKSLDPSEDGQMGLLALSPEVESAVNEAVSMVESLVAEYQGKEILNANERDR
jgi:hydrogenase maturation protease